MSDLTMVLIDASIRQYNEQFKSYMASDSGESVFYCRTINRDDNSIVVSIVYGYKDSNFTSPAWVLGRFDLTNDSDVLRFEEYLYAELSAELL